VKYFIFIIILFAFGCKGGMDGSDRSHFDSDHTPYLGMPKTFLSSIVSASSLSVALKWESSIGADNYVVQYKTSDSNTWLISSSQARSPYTVSGLSASTNYDFMVVAKNSIGEMNSNVITMQTSANSHAPIVLTMAVSTFDEGTQQMVTLAYTSPSGDLATACEATDFVNAYMSRSCQCDGAGVCTVGITGNSQFFGAGNFRYRVMIGSDASTYATAYFTISPVNDAPTISNVIIPSSIQEDASGVVSFTITDPDSTLNCSSTYLSATSSNTTLVPVTNIVFGGTYPNCTASISPAANLFGTSNVVVSVSDGTSSSATGTLTITVNAVNDAPTISAISAQSMNQDATKTVNFTIGDIDSPGVTCANVTGTSSNTSILANSGIVITGSAQSCVATLTPVATKNGSLNVTLTVSDGALLASSNFALSILAVNTAPTFSNLIGNTSVNEDGTSAVSFTVNDPDSTIACSSSYLSAASSTPSVVLSTDITFSGTYPNCVATIHPLANQNGSTNITFTVTDGMASSSSNAFQLTVNAVNDAPTISPILAQSISQNSLANVSFTIGDIDSTLTCTGSVTASSSNTTILANTGISIGGTYPSCTAVVTPVTGKSGSVDVTFTVSDTQLTSQAIFSLAITAVNTAPTIANISGTSVNEDTPAVFNLVVNDPDSTIACSSSYLSFTSSNSALVNSSSVVFGGTYPNCTATVTPLLNQNGTTSLAFTVSDGMASNTTNSATLTILAVDDAPVIAPVATQNLALNQAGVITLNVTDVDSTINCTSDLSGVSSDTSSVLSSSIIFSGTAPSCVATITPVNNQHGPTTITITATSGSASSSTSFVMTFGSSSTPPVASNITPASFAEDTASTITLSYDNNNALATSCFISSPSNVTVTTACACNGQGVCTVGVKGTSNYNGSAGFSYTVTANNLSSNTATATFNITAFNDAPTISAISAQSTVEDTAKTVNFTINDVDNTLICNNSFISISSTDVTLIDPTTIAISGTAPNCQASITPNANKNGSASLTFIVTDGSLTAQSAFTMTVTPVNDAPTISTITAQTTNEDMSKTVNFTIGDVDSTITCSGSVTAATSNASLVKVSDINFSGTYPNCVATINPESNMNGPVNLTFTVSDGALSAATTFALTINAVNDAPTIATIIAQSTNEGSSKTVNFTIADVDSPIACSDVTGVSSNTALVTNAHISISGTAPSCIATITPTAYQNGTSSITLTVSDGILSSQSSFVLTVLPVNDAPTVAFISNASSSEDTPAVINFTINDVDSTIACNSSYLSAASSNASLILSTDVVFSGTYPNCVATISPLANQNGASNITFTVTDGTDSSTSNAFQLSVLAVNDAPTISTIMAQTMDEDTAKLVNFTIGDIDSSIACSSVNVTASSSNTSILTNAGIVISGTYPNCVATITPVLFKNGVVNVTLTASDGALNASSTFSLTINPINNAPTMPLIVAQVTNEDTALVVNVPIDDVDGPLVCAARVTASSGNTALVANANIVIGGTYPNCTATITPSANLFGVASITMTVSDGALSASRIFVLTVVSVDDPPVATNITSASVTEDVQASITLPYVDLDGDQATSCNVTNLSNVTITSACACASGVCTVGITGSSNYNGTAGFNFSVTAGGVTSNTGSASFSIAAVNDAPTMSAITSKNMDEDGTLAVSFTIADVDSTLTCAGSVTAASSDISKVLNTGVVITGTAPNCTATITPVADANGSVNITLSVSDTHLTAQRTFALAILPILDVGGSITVSGVADTTFGRTLSFSTIILDETVSKVEVCISEDVDLNNVISNVEKCNTVNWVDITSAIGASGTSSTSGWSSYTIKKGVNGAVFTQDLVATCASGATRQYVTHVRITNASQGTTTEVVTAPFSFWNPSCLGTALGIWLDAKDTATMFTNSTCTTAVSGSPASVNCWLDKSLNAYRFNATATTVPTYVSTAWSGSRPSVTFNGSNDLKRTGINLTPKNIFAAINVSGTASYEGLLGIAAGDVGVRTNGSGGSWTSDALNVGGDFTYSGLIGGTTGYTYINGTSGTVFTPSSEHLFYQSKGTGSTTTWADVGLGGYYELLGVKSRRIHANISEVFVCTTDCSGYQTRFEGYMAHKWGLTGNLPAGHPYKTTPP
jgi:hypothetical protein